MKKEEITTNNTCSVTDGVAESVTQKQTKETILQKSDNELLQMVKDAAGHTGKDFQEYMNCDFSYSHLTTTLKNRGYENGWHKVRDSPSSLQAPLIIPMKKSENETCRKTFSIDKVIADEWTDLSKDIPYKTVPIGIALKRFMDDYNAGRIKFEIGANTRDSVK